MDIAADLQEIAFILDQTGRISALKKMAGEVVLVIEIHAVGMQDPLHDLPELRVRRLYGHMKMIRHETDRMDLELVDLLRPLDALQKTDVIRRLAEQSCSSIPPAHHVIDGPGVP